MEIYMGVPRLSGTPMLALLPEARQREGKKLVSARIYNLHIVFLGKMWYDSYVKNRAIGCVTEKEYELWQNLSN